MTVTCLILDGLLINSNADMSPAATNSFEFPGTTGTALAVGFKPKFLSVRLLTIDPPIALTKL